MTWTARRRGRSSGTRTVHLGSDGHVRVEVTQPECPQSSRTTLAVVLVLLLILGAGFGLAHIRAADSVDSSGLSSDCINACFASRIYAPHRVKTLSDDQFPPLRQWSVRRFGNEKFQTSCYLDRPDGAQGSRLVCVVARDADGWWLESIRIE